MPDRVSREAQNIAAGYRVDLALNSLNPAANPPQAAPWLSPLVEPSLLSDHIQGSHSLPKGHNGSCSEHSPAA